MLAEPLAQLFSLSGRIALITGASRGLGKAMARALAEAGADVIISSREARDLKPALGEITAGLATRGAYIPADLAARDETEHLATAALEVFGRVDILVSNAGGSNPQALDELTDEGWDRVLEQNLSAGMVLTRALAPAMKERGWGRLIYTSSTIAFGALGSRSAYTTSKGGGLGLTRVAALELGKFGITANAIAPGPFNSDMQKLLTADQQANLRHSQKRLPMGRAGEPRELAGVVVLLASDAGSYINGATLVVDGGAMNRAF